MTPLLEVDSITKTYRDGGDSVRALDGVSLSIAPGEIVALLGNNGAGKSTLMSICAGLIEADSGRVVVAGDDVTSEGSSPLVGLAPQEEALYPTLTVRRNLEYFGMLAGLKGADLALKVREVSQSLLIEELLDRKANELSGGQRRRLHTGLALMHSPSVLLLDEPTVGVDIDARAELLEFVRSAATNGAAVLYSTHQLHEVEALRARVVVIDGGRVMATGTVEDLVAAYAYPTAELRFAGGAPQLPAEAAEAVVEASTLTSGDYRIVLRLAGEGTHITQVVDELGSADRDRLVAAWVAPASLEHAYQRIVRGHGPEAGGDDRPGGSGGLERSAAVGGE